MARNRYRRAIDLYVVGEVVELKDGTPAWVQILNPFEQDTARSEAQIAKARVTLALRQHGSDEQAKVRSLFFEDGPLIAAQRLIDAKMTEERPRLLEKLRYDPDWRERFEILDRGLEDTAVPPGEDEKQLLDSISAEITTELAERIRAEREFHASQWDKASEEDLWAAYLEWYVERRGVDTMLAEYRLWRLFLGARCCQATRIDGGAWNHANCDGHREQIFETIAEARSAPQELQLDLMSAAEGIELSAREAKNSDRPGSSSDSSPRPSEVGESTSSTPAETQAEHPGPSSSPSPMR